MDDNLAKAAEYLRGLSPNDREAAFKGLRLETLKDKPAAEIATPPPIKTLQELWDDPPEIPPALVDQCVLVPGELSAMVGGTGFGKTHICLGRILRWAGGLPLFNGESPVQTPERPLKTLVIENEGSKGRLFEKMHKMVVDGPFDEEQAQMVRDNIFVWGELGFSSFKLDAEADVRMLRAGIEKFQPDVVFMEPFRRLWIGDENDNSAMGKVVDTMADLAVHYNIAIWISHHERKSGKGEDDEVYAGRGGGVLSDLAGCVERFVKEGEPPNDRRILRNTKNRHNLDGLYEAITMQWDPDQRFYTYVPADQQRQDIMRHLSKTDPTKANELAELLQIPLARVNMYLKECERRGDAKRFSGGGRGGFDWLAVDKAAEQSDDISF